MIKKRKTRRRRPSGLEELRNRLYTAEETLRAIRAGEVDAVVATRAGDDRVITFQGADLPYRNLLDQMFAGAVTMTPDGSIVYCNRRFANIVRMPLARVIGLALSRFVPPAGQATIEALLERASRDQTRAELVFRAGDGTAVPVSVSFGPLRLEGNADIQGVIGVVVDATERAQQEEVRNRLIEQVVTAQDEERRRIARELHDETGQSLTALLVGLRTIEGSKTVAQAVGMARRLRATTAQTLVDVGRLWRGLHPGVLDLGLVAAVTRHAQEFAQAHGIAVDVRTNGLDPDGLSPLLQATVYRVLQEALTNVAKHAAARNVAVRLVRHGGAVELCVRDDGIGLGPKVQARGLGLQGMRERAVLLGGSVEVGSQMGKGTTLTATFPVQPAA